MQRSYGSRWKFMAMAGLVAAASAWLWAQSWTAAEPNHSHPNAVVPSIQTAAPPAAKRWGANPWAQLAAPHVALSDEDAEEPLYGPIDGPLWMLPPDTLAMAYAPVWSDVAQTFNLDTLLQSLGDTTDRADAWLGELGLSLADVSDPSTLGIDPHDAVVMGWLDFSEPVFFVGARLSDPEAFSQAITAALYTGDGGTDYEASAETGAEDGTEDHRETRVHFEQHGDALAIKPNGPHSEVVVLTRGSAVFVLVCDHWRGTVDAAVAQFSWQDPALSLPTTAAWQDAMRNVKGELAFGFLNLPALRVQVAASMESELEQIRREREEVMAQQIAGEPDGESYWQDYRLKQAQTSRKLVDVFLGGLGPAAIGAEVNGGSLLVSGRMLMERDSLPARLMKNRHRTSAMQRALGASATFFLDVSLEPDETKQLVRRAMAAADQDLDNALLAAAVFLQVDPFTLWGGEFGMLMHPAVEREHNSHELSWGPTPGFSFFVGINDTTATRALVNRLERLGEMTEGLLRSNEDDTWSFATPGGPVLVASIIDNAICATTESEVLASVKGAGPQGNNTAGIHERALAIGKEPGNALAMGWQFSGFATPEWEPPDSNADWRADETTDEKQREFQKVSDEIAATYRECDRRSAVEERRLLSLLGSLAFSVRNDGTSLRLEGGWYTNANDAAQLAIEIARALQAQEAISVDREAALRPLYDRQTALSPYRADIPAEPAFQEHAQEHAQEQEQAWDSPMYAPPYVEPAMEPELDPIPMEPFKGTPKMAWSDEHFPGDIPLDDAPWEEPEQNEPNPDALLLEDPLFPEYWIY